MIEERLAVLNVHMERANFAGHSDVIKQIQLICSYFDVYLTGPLLMPRAAAPLAYMAHLLLVQAVIRGGESA